MAVHSTSNRSVSAALAFPRFESAEPTRDPSGVTEREAGAFSARGPVPAMVFVAPVANPAHQRLADITRFLEQGHALPKLQSAPNTQGFFKTLVKDGRAYDGPLVEAFLRPSDQQLYVKETGSGFGGPNTVGPFWYGPVRLATPVVGRRAVEAKRSLWAEIKKVQSRMTYDLRAEDSVKGIVIRTTPRGSDLVVELKDPSNDSAWVDEAIHAQLEALQFADVDFTVRGDAFPTRPRVKQVEKKLRQDLIRIQSRFTDEMRMEDGVAGLRTTRRDEDGQYFLEVHVPPNGNYPTDAVGDAVRERLNVLGYGHIQFEVRPTVPAPKDALP